MITNVDQIEDLMGHQPRLNATFDWPELPETLTLTYGWDAGDGRETPQYLTIHTHVPDRPEPYQSRTYRLVQDGTDTPTLNQRFAGRRRLILNLWQSELVGGRLQLEGVDRLVGMLLCSLQTFRIPIRSGRRKHKGDPPAAA